MKSNLLFIAILACVFNMNAQKIKLLHATQQGWSGGVAGRYGTNYYMEIETSDLHIIPDTVWVNGIPYSIDFSNANTGCSESVDKLHNAVKYSISVSEEHDENQEMQNLIENKHSPEKKTTKKYNGAALVTYMYKGKRCSFTVKQFKSLEAVNYP